MNFPAKHSLQRIFSAKLSLQHILPQNIFKKNTLLQNMDPFNPNYYFGQSSNDSFSHQSFNYPSQNSYNTITPSTQYSNPPPFTQSYNHPFENDEESLDEESLENLLQWQAVCTVAAYTCAYYFETFIRKKPCHDSCRTGSRLIQEILEGNETRCYQDFRMNKDVFISFCKILVDRYGLVPTSGMSEYEEVGMFLMTVAHGTGNRLMQEMWNHSGETISRHFHSVLDAVCRMTRDIIIPHSNYKNGVGYHRPQHPRYYPHFKVSLYVHI